MKNKDIQWVNVWERVEDNPSLFFFIIVGQRGDGKTYGALKPLALEQYDGKFIYLRKTQTVIENACTDALNPFKALNRDLGTDVRMEADHEAITIVKGQDEDKRIIGYAAALTTQGKIKGVDYSDVNYIIYDEFMEGGGRRIMKNEAMALFNFYETVNRNREFNGEDPVKVILMGNSETLNNDIIDTFQLADKVYDMKQGKYSKNDHIYTDEEKGLYFELVKGGRFAELKKETALYKLTKGTEFYDFALANNFTGDYMGDVERYKAHDLEPIACLTNIYFYRIKSTGNIYVTYRKSNCKKYSEQQLQAFRSDYGMMLLNADSRDKIRYADMNIKLKLDRILEK